LRPPIRTCADGRRQLMTQVRVPAFPIDLVVAPVAVVVVIVLAVTHLRAQSSIGPLRPLPTPAAASSAQPQLAVAPDGRVVLSWLEHTGNSKARAFRYSYRTESGWTAASTITTRDNFFVNWADVPSVYPLGGGRLVAHWLQYNGAGTYAYDVRLSFSDAQGRNWTPDVAPHRDGTTSEHGFASFFEWPGGGTGVVWLDGREMAGGHGAGHGEERGAMTLRAARIAPDGTIGEDVRIDARVCECCPTTAVATSRAAVVAYRDRSGSEMRDIGVLRLEDGKWSAPALVHADNWQINACPVNGPALAASGDRVALAWFTAEGDRPRVQVAFSSNAGRTWSQPVRVDEQKSLGRVDVVMLDNGGAVVMWMEHLETGSELRARVVHPSGRRDPFITVASMTSDRQSGYARMVRSGDELLFAWVATKPTMQVKTAVATITEK
jgi:hypothetical protein